MIGAAAAAVRHELVGLGGVVERNWYLVKRYAWWELAFFVWTVANTLTIVFIAKGIEATGGSIDVEATTTALLIGVGGVVERTLYLTRRYAWWELAFFVWTVANTLTIVLIADGVEAAGGQLDVERQTTILLCTHDLAEAEALADRVGIIDRGRLLRLEPVDALIAHYGAATLEEAFFAATGRTLADDSEEDDDEREVFA